MSNKNSHFTILPIRTVYHGSESISPLGPKIWNISPERLKNANSIEAFKMQIKKMEAWKLSMSAFQGLCSKCRFYLRKRTKAFMWNITLWFYEILVLWFYDLCIFFYFMFNLQFFIFSTFGSWRQLACIYT